MPQARRANRKWGHGRMHGLTARIGPRRSGLRSGLATEPTAWKSNGRSFCRAAGNGSILIVVLWILFFLGALAVAIGAYVGAQVELARRLDYRLRSYYVARAGVARAVAVLGADTNAWDAFPERWGSSVVDFSNAPCGDGFFSVTYAIERADGTLAPGAGLSDEGGKIDINKAPPELLAALLRIAGGLNSLTAAGVAAAIVQARTPVDAESTMSGPGPGTWRGGAFKTTSELAYVHGMSGDVLAKIRTYVTVWGELRINVNTAGRVVLLCLASPGANSSPGEAAADGLARKILKFREHAGIFTSSLPPKLVDTLEQSERLTGEERTVFYGMAPRLSVQSDVFRGRSSGALGADPHQGRTIEFVWDRVQRRILCWNED